MKEVRTEISIDAPADKVWERLMKFSEWDSWNPTVVRVDGEHGIGNQLKITMMNGDQEMSYMAQIEESESSKKFRWRAKMLGGWLFTNDRVFELTEKEGKTVLVHKELFGGIMLLFSWTKLQKFVPNILDKMNQALKKTVET